MVILGRGLDGLNLDTDSLIVGVGGLLDELSVGTLNQVLTVTGSGVEWADAAVSGLLNVVEDLTPQLGGELDAQTFKIVNLSDPTLDQDAATKFYVDNQISTSTPALGLNDLSDVDTTGLLGGDVLTYNDISGNWEPQAGAGGGGLNNVVEDLTPQLGGSLDAQGAYKIVNLVDPTLNQDAATKFYVDTELADLVDSAPATLDTLNELAAALGDDPNFATTVTNAIAAKVAKAGDTMTGFLVLNADPTAALHAATKQYVDAQSGEDNTMSNLAGGSVGVFKQKAGVNFEMRPLTGTGGTTVSLNGDVIEIDSPSGTLTSVATGIGLTGGPITTTGTIDLDINSLTTDAGFDGAADFLAYHDTSTGIIKKVLINSLGIGDLLAANNLSELTATQATARTNIGAASQADLTAHTGNTSNPHSVTAAQTGAVAKIGDTMTGALQFNTGASLTSDTGVTLDISAATGEKVNIEGDNIELQGTNGTGGQLLINADGSIQLRPASGFDLTLGDDIIMPFSIGTPGQILQVDGTGTFLEFAVNAGGGVNALTDLTDTDISSPANGEVLQYNGSDWANVVLSHIDLGDIGTNTHAQIDSHIASTSNPHSVTAAQVGALANVVEDLTPQLGGNLDIQANLINTSTVNGNIQLVPNGTGAVVVGDGSNGIITTEDAATSSGLAGYNLSLLAGDGDGVGDGGDILITPGTAPGAGTDGVVVIDGLIWPETDGSSGQVIVTDGLGNLSFTTVGGLQNLWLNILSDSGSTAANSATDTLSILGGTGISTAVAADTVTITNTSPNVDQNIWLNVSGDAGSTAANTTTDTLTIAGGTGISTAMAGDTLTITNDSPNADQNIWSTVTADTGSASANTTSDNLTIAGGTNVTTTIVGDTLTIDATGGSTQNLWETIVGDSGSTAADTTTDTLTIAGSGAISTAVSGDTLTITTTALQDITAESILDLSDTPGSFGTTGQVLAVNGGGTALEFVTPSSSGGATEERFRLNYATNGDLTSIDNTTSGVNTTTILSPTGGDVEIDFTGHAYPPSSIVIYGYAYTANKYTMIFPDATFSMRQVAGGGSSGSPTAFGAFTTKLTLTLREAETGASRGFGTTTHAWVMFIFGD